MKTETEAASATPDSATLSRRLAGRGEEALRRLSSEIDKNARAQDAKDRLAKLQRTTMQQLGIAPAEEVQELKKEVASLEKRLAKLEKHAAADQSSKSA